ncbi:MAG TPA: sugar ABC transporter substrate-binding protein [Pseudonocardiaceae bacterium]|nr:sugar ABC transporter substrate-binding protein [Pseudonocardiaceae bacterium]
MPHRSNPRPAGRTGGSRRRVFAPVACALLSIGLLAACGGGGTNNSAAGNGKPVDITFWGWTRGSQQVVDAFNAVHKDVHVTFEQIPSGTDGGYAKLFNAIKAGNEPDVFNVEYPMLPSFVSQGGVQNISTEVHGLTSHYLPQTVQLTTLGGQNWGLPLDADPQVFFYRKDLFDKYHIAVPTTWTDFRTAAQQLKAADPATRIASFFTDDPSTFEASAWQAGAHWFGTQGDAWKVNLVDGPTQMVTNYWQSMIDDDLVRVQPYFGQQWSSDLQSGQLAGYLGAAWSAGSLKSALPSQSGDWAAAPIPTWDGHAATGMLGGSVFVVGKDSKNMSADIEFSSWATSTVAGMKARISSGISSVYPADPALVATAKNGFSTTFYGGQDIFSVFSVDGNAFRPGWTWGPSMDTTNTAISDVFGKLTSGGTVAQALQQGQTATLADLKNRGLKVAPQ